MRVPNRKLTQEEIAEAAGLQASRLSEYESGRLAPQLERAAKLAAAQGLAAAPQEAAGLRRAVASSPQVVRPVAAT